MEKLVIDTDFIINYLLITESNHDRVTKFVSDFQYQFVCLNLVKVETANVLSRKLNQAEAISLFESLIWENFDYRFLDESLEFIAVKMFRQQTRKNISLTDCANLALAHELNCKVASFDDFYKGFRFFE